MSSPRSRLIFPIMSSRRVNHQVASAAPANPNSTPSLDRVMSVSPFYGLALDHGLEQYRSQMAAEILVVRGFLDDQTCGAVREAMDAGIVEAAEVLSTGIDERDDVRRAASIDVDAQILEEVERRLDAELDRVSAFFGTPLTGREGSGFLRYAPGGFYRPHRDRATVDSWPGAARRRVTAVIFLNAGGFSGGVLHIGDYAITPEAGMLAAFRAETLHEVTMVSGGVRDTVVDWYLD
jgi:SM-20-related protein